jgi:hypothetical protein
MKKIFLSLCASLLALGAGVSSARAQEPVTTGVVTEVIPKTGVLTVLSDQTHKPVTFYGAGKSNIFSTDGAPAQLVDLTVGRQVTVRYAERNGAWYIEKIMFVGDKPASITQPVVPQSGRVSPVQIINGTGKN